ncbi:MAG: hypothetical protein EBX41_02985 [Chitinophagia bacterium]|nr:hypothetical protein [Chitinophagia bacterium]
MYHLPIKPVVVLILCLLFFNCAMAQTSSVSNPTSLKENNPYSKYGVGELWNGNNTPLKAMGSITSAWNDNYLLNPDNPATYSQLSITTFEGGMAGSTRTITTAAGAKYQSATSSLGHFPALIMPLPILYGVLLRP